MLWSSRQKVKCQLCALSSIWAALHLCYGGILPRQCKWNCFRLDGWTVHRILSNVHWLINQNNSRTQFSAWFNLVPLWCGLLRIEFFQFTTFVYYFQCISSVIILTLYCTMSQNGQIRFKNLAAFAARFLKCVWPFQDVMR